MTQTKRFRTSTILVAYIVALGILANTLFADRDPLDPLKFKYHVPPVPKKAFPAIREFFTFGIYNAVPGGYDEMLNRKQLNRTTAEAWDRQYRHYILHNFNFFAHNLNPSQRNLDHHLRLAEKYGGKHEFYYFIGYPVETVTGKTSGYVRWPLALTTQRFLDFIRLYADSPHILYWRMWDETGGFNKFQQEYYFTIKEKAYEIDKLHPITFIEQGSPSPLTPQFEYGLGECYSFYGVWTNGRDLSRPEDHIPKNWEHFKHQTVRNCILWVEGFGPYDPTPAEARAEVYHMLANGWNSLMFYSGGVRKPCWSTWSKHDPLARKFQTYQFLHYGLSNNFDFRPDFMLELSTLGEKLIPLGYLFLKGEFDPQAPYVAAGGDALLERSFADPDTGAWTLTKKSEPALRLGLYRHPNAELLVAYNRDLDHPREGVVDLKGKQGDRKVYDLYTFAEIPLKDGTFPVKFDAGGGGLYLLAEEAAFLNHKKEILRRKFDHESNKLRIRLNIARETGLLDLASIDRQLEGARKTHKANDFVKACELLKQTKGAFETTCNRHETYRSITAGLREASDTFWKIDMWLRKRLPILMAEPEDQGGWKFHPPLGMGRPALEAILVPLRKAAAKYYPLSLAFEGGKTRTPRYSRIS